ncbi:Putative acyltransferase 3 family protein; Putative Glucans biosynthesis protein C [Bradyrhizobium sp. ORS 278]|uniref:acyltransferase family protein n=1 Tax=Bradyrhizobium sp. (strain ORS 278) TaxID=114615 RepID=UPI00015087F4|nr:acyltransferase family protein [Bradyrhizobium sp. ORS 278]CAL79812.1 Putative acyltransferase 3 family protein; Putative Glucans biosynthesis protein C [Bradyrhizobium sp. ORS 278]
MPSTTSPASTSERLHALDAVRAIALLLGIVLHSAISFVPPGPTRTWFIEDTHPSAMLGIVTFVIHVFRMTTFFLMAGLFARMSLHRRGVTGFVKDRLLRIALPLVVTWPILFVPMAVVVMWASQFPHGGPVPSMGGWPPDLPRFPLTHLWFLYVLIELYAAALLLRWGVAVIDTDGRWHAAADRLFARIMHSRLAPAILALPIMIALSLDPRWVGFIGVRTPDQSLITNGQAWIGFGTAFAVGWLLHRQIALLKVLEQRWMFNAAAAIVLTGLSFALALGVAMVARRVWAAPVDLSTLRLAGAIVYALAIWTTSFAAIGLALRFMAGFSPARRYLADASYWLYLIHLPIVMALQVAVSQLDWPWPAKYALILLVAMPTMLASYHWLVRDTVLGRMLNGKRINRPAAPMPVIGDSVRT